MLIHDFLVNSAKKYPGKKAIIHAGKHYTYSEIFKTVKKIGNLLVSENFKPGFRAAILTDDPYEYITSYFGILMAGGIAVGLNTQPSPRSLKTILNDCAPSVFFLHPKFLRYFQAIAKELNDEIKVVLSGGSLPDDSNIISRAKILSGSAEPQLTVNKQQPSDLAQIIYTSGTTGKPKGVVLSHANLVANTRSIISYLGLTASDRVMAVLPFFYSYGNSVMLTHIAVGGSLVVNQSFLYPNVILDEMVKEEVTGFSGVPSTFAILLNRSAIKNYSFSKLRYITQAGAAMSPELAKRLQEALPNVQIFIMYGQTEASARLSYLAPEDLYRKAGSIGKAIPGVTLQLLDKNGSAVPNGKPGEIVAQGENVMVGYWNKPEETKQVLRKEGLWTGDLAQSDDEGYLFIISRKSDIIKSGSHRIAPKEIEEIILEHPAVHEVAVLGVSDEILGESIKACVVLLEGMVCSAKELQKHCKKNLSAYKVPQHFEFYKELYKTATGKIQKGKLK